MFFLIFDGFFFKVEALPKENNYRDLASILENGHRPTLEELKQGRLNESVKVSNNYSVWKFLKKSHLVYYWKPEVCGQKVLPDRSILMNKNCWKMSKIQKCDFLGEFQTLWIMSLKVSKINYGKMWHTLNSGTIWVSITQPISRKSQVLS